MLIKRLQGQLEKRNGFYYEFDMHSKPLGEGGMGATARSLSATSMEDLPPTATRAMLRL